MLRNDTDTGAVTVGLQPRDCACTTTQREEQPVAAPLKERRLQTSRMTVDIASQQRLSSKKTNLPGLGLIKGWGFLRTKYR